MAADGLVQDYMDKVASAASRIRDTAMSAAKFNECRQLVWHYTNMTALHGIFTSRNIRMSHIHSMNDVSEFHYGLNDVMAFLNEEMNIGDDLSKFIKNIVGVYNGSSAKAGLFLASFCKRGESIPHWQIYSGGGTGVSIGFDWRELVGEVGYDIVPVIYDKASGRKYLLELMQECFEIYKLAVGNVLQAELERLLIGMSAAIDVVAASMKMECFAHEQECRLVALQYNGNTGVKFSPSGGMIKSYIEYDLGRELKCIKEIRVGPARYQESVMRSLEFFLKELGFDEIRVNKFETPYLFSE